MGPTSNRVRRASESSRVKGLERRLERGRVDDIEGARVPNEQAEGNVAEGHDAPSQPKGKRGGAAGTESVGAPTEQAVGNVAGSGGSSGRPKGTRARNRLSNVLPYLILAAGMVVLMWPVVNSWIEAWQAERSIDDIVATYDEMSDPERAALRAEARRYNDVIAAGGNLEECTPYEEQLSFEGSEMIAYIAIPKCSIRLPVYHGTEDRVLMAGVGHLKSSSLPAGGESSHCVLTAHTGVPGRRMFDDIHLLEAGDEFVVWVLGEPLAYRVYDTEVVLPDRVESLRIQRGRDLCTLITCTPYGVNSHRLLVHAERCAYVEGAEDVPDIAVYVNARTLPLLIAVGALIALVVALAARRASRRRRRTKAGRGVETPGSK